MLNISSILVRNLQTTMQKIGILLTLCSFALGLTRAQRPYNPQRSYDPQPSYQAQPRAFRSDDYEEPPRPYAFDYGVQDADSGANFGHSETSDGNAVTGSYTVALPDGRIQRVTYTADEYNGFQAEVTYEGEATYPEYAPERPSPNQLRPKLYRPKPRPRFGVNQYT